MNRRAPRRHGACKHAPYLNAALVALAAIAFPSVASAGLKDVLLVVADPAALNAQENYRKVGLEGYGYTVTLIDDDASQASFDAAVVGKNVASVAPTVSSASLGTKLKNITIGVVCEQWTSADEFGFSDTSVATHSRNYLAVQSVTHYITYGYSGNVTILNSNQTMARRSGAIAPGAIDLAQVEGGGGTFSPGLLVLNTGAALSGGGTAAGRRVLLPVGATTFDISQLNATGQAIFLRAVEWAARPNPAVGDLLLVVTSTSAPTTQEVTRRLLFDTWGYNVTLIDDADSQANFDTQLATHDVVYVSEEIDSASLGTKLLNATVGVVNEEFDLADEIQFATSRTFTTGTAVNVNNNSHSITSQFATGSLTLFSSSQSVGYLSGTHAVGQQTLTRWGTERGLVVLEQGGALASSGNAAGRRVQLPWGGSTFDVNSLNANGKTLARRAIEWAAMAPGTPMLMPVIDPDVPTAQEAARITLFESFGYRVNTIDESAAQADFNLALAGVGLAYVCEEIASANLSTKLTSAALGVLNEEQALLDELGISSIAVGGSGTQLQIDLNTHYITSPFATGARTIFTSSQEMVALSGTIPTDAYTLGSWSGNKALVALEAGGKTYSGGSFAGRRVQLPFGGNSFDIGALNADGRTILQRAMQWAGGMSGYWRLDETTGTLASDSSGKRNHGTLTGFTFDTASISPGKLGNALNLNGTTNYISIPNASSLQPTSALSISAWIKGDAWGSGSNVDTILRKGEANPNNYQLAIADGRVALYLDDSDTAGHRGDTVLQTGVWYHVAATWDGSQVKVYVNGLLDHSPPTSKAAPIAVDTRPLYIGGRSGTDLFDGVIDDVRLFNYALTPQEILELKGTGQPNGIRIVKWVELP